MNGGCEEGLICNMKEIAPANMGRCRREGDIVIIAETIASFDQPLLRQAGKIVLWLLLFLKHEYYFLKERKVNQVTFLSKPG